MVEPAQYQKWRPNPKWMYGDAGDKFPVDFHDIWQVGDHVFACGDVQRGDAAQLIELSGSLFGKPISMVYTDPPWDAGAAKAFRTKAGFQDGLVNFEQFSVQMAKQYPDVDIFIEGGVRDQAAQPGWYRRAGFHVVGAWQIRYNRGGPVFREMKETDPCWLYHLRRSAPLASFGIDFTNMHDDETPLLALTNCTEPGDVVHDSTMGLGGSLRRVVENGRYALGLELHPRRLACAIEYFVKKHGFEARKIGELS